MLTPKEKAEELVYKMYAGFVHSLYSYKAKQCALIAVDEIVKIEKHHCHNLWVDYWLEVKTELEKL